MTLSAAAREYLLAFADDEHLIGARHTNWIGLGPFLEEDLAFCSIAEDELGHAVALYGLLLDDPAQLDAFAMMRDPSDYRSCWLAESNAPIGATRSCATGCMTVPRRSAGTSSPPAPTTASARSPRERNVRSRSTLRTPSSSCRAIAATDTTGRIIDSIGHLVPLAAGLWDATQSEPSAISEGFVRTSSGELADAWEHLVRADLDRWGLDVDWPRPPRTADQRSAQRNRTVRSESFAQLQADLLRVVVLDPTAVW